MVGSRKTRKLTQTVIYPVRNNAPLLPTGQAPPRKGSRPGGRPFLWGGAWASGCTGVRFYNNSACLPRPRSGPPACR